MTEGEDVKVAEDSLPCDHMTVHRILLSIITTPDGHQCSLIYTQTYMYDIYVHNIYLYREFYSPLFEFYLFYTILS